MSMSEITLPLRVVVIASLHNSVPVPSLKEGGSYQVIDTCFVQQLQLSMEHHEWVSINAQLHSEACFDFELGIK